MTKKNKEHAIAIYDGKDLYIGGDVVELIETGELIFPFADFYSGGDVRSSGFTAKRIAHYSPNLDVWHPFEYAQQSVHLTAFGVGMLAILAGYVVFLFRLLRKFGGK